MTFIGKLRTSWLEIMAASFTVISLSLVYRACERFVAG
jgi:hypothetical protein